jgi:YaiO family outer membrane protein
MSADYQAISAPSAQTQPAQASAFDTQFEQARSLVKSGQLELALPGLDALLARSPGNADVLLARGTVHARLHHWEAAESDLLAAAAAAPAYADVWSALGNMYLWSEQPQKAAEAFNRVVALRPLDPEARLARARALRALKRDAEARQDLEQARALGASVVLDEAPAAAAPRAGTPEAVAPAGYRWLATLSSSRTDPGAGSRWSDQMASVRRYGQHGSLAFEALRSQRFGQSDGAWALDGYARLWSGAYANLRYQRSPGTGLFPQNAGRVELWQSLGDGWEASASKDVLAFAQARVNIHGVSLGKYFGNFYAQLRHQNIVSPGAHGSGDRLLARYYYLGDADNFVELAANSGRSDDAGSLVGGRARSGGGSVAWVRYWSPLWGVRAGASVARAGAANEQGVSAALYRRW